MLEFQKQVALHKLETDKMQEQTENQMRAANTVAGETSIAAINAFKAYGH